MYNIISNSMTLLEIKSTYYSLYEIEKLIAWFTSLAIKSLN